MKWEMSTIGQHCTVTSSKRFHLSDRCNYGIPFYCSKEIIQKVNGEIVTECDYIKEDAYESVKKQFGVPVCGDLLITTRGTYGVPYIYRDTDKFYFADGNLTWLKDFDNHLLVKFLYYWILSHEGQKKIDAIAKGTAQKAVPIATLKLIEIPLPPIETQKRIADILSAYDDLIENNQKQIKLLEEAAQRLYKEWFVDLRFPGHEHTAIVDGVPEGWSRKKLIDIADVQYGYAFDGSLFNSSCQGTPIIRIRNIPDGFTNDYTTEETDDKYLVNNGDIVVGMDGEFHINTWGGDVAYLVQRTCRIKPINPVFHGWLLYAIYEPIKFYEKTLVGATVAHLGKKHIDSIELLVGTNELYIPFQEYYDKRLILMNQNRKLKEARDRLLPKLMNGEMEV